MHCPKTYHPLFGCWHSHTLLLSSAILFWREKLRNSNEINKLIVNVTFHLLTVQVSADESLYQRRNGGLYAGQCQIRCMCLVPLGWAQRAERGHSEKSISEFLRRFSCFLNIQPPSGSVKVSVVWPQRIFWTDYATPEAAIIFLQNWWEKEGKRKEGRMSLWKLMKWGAMFRSYFWKLKILLLIGI